MGTLIIVICIITGIICGLAVSAGIIYRFIVRSNVLGFPETENEFMLKHDISYNEISDGHQILFF